MTAPVSWNEYKKPLSLSLGITALVWILLFTIVSFDPSRQKQGLLINRSNDTSIQPPQVLP